MSELPKLKTKFPEPVVDSGADPYVVIHGDHFYYCHVSDNDTKICIRRSRQLEGIGEAEAVMVFEAPDQPHGKSMWAPELHYLDGKWYIYYAAGEPTHYFDNQRMYVLEGKGDDPQTAAYRFKGKIADEDDQWAIDGTVMTMESGARYFIWSGWEAPGKLPQYLYIAPMKNPWTLIGKRVKISAPIYEWEQRGQLINEGPQVLPRGASRQIIYSASWSITDYYCLAQLDLVGSDPLDPTHWIKHPKPIFESHKGLIAPGHASFILTPKEDYGWMIFHTARHAGAAWDRQVRLMAFEALADGTLKFISKESLSDRLRGIASLHSLLNRIIKK